MRGTLSAAVTCVLLLLGLTVAPVGAQVQLQFSRTDYDAGGAGRRLAVGDLDGDGKPDLVVANWVDLAVSVLRNTGDGTFSAPVRYPMSANPYDACEPLDVKLGDLDGDGHLDIVVGNWCGIGAIAVLYNTGNGTFGRPRYYDLDAAVGGVAVSDVDGDGRVDVLVADVLFDAVRVLLNKSRGQRPSRRDLVEDGVYTVPPYGATSISAGDLDHDGLPEAVSSIDACYPDPRETCDGVIAVLRNRGDGTLGVAVTYRLSDIPNDVAIGDLDGDGHPDLAVGVGWQYGTPQATVAVLRGRGDGTLAQAVDYPLAEAGAACWPVAVSLGDVDGDGTLDAVAVCYMDPGTVVVLPNMGDGALGPFQTFPVGQGPSSVVVADFDGDGRLDVATSSWLENTVSVLLNRTPAATARPVP